jgi:hypothetical protein
LFDAIFLTPHPSLTKYRDLFIVGCLTGFRFSDYSTLNPYHLKDGMLHVRQDKTGQAVVVPLRNDARNISRILFDPQNFGRLHARFFLSAASLSAEANVSAVFSQFRSGMLPRHSILPHNDNWKFRTVT